MRKLLSLTDFEPIMISNGPLECSAWAPGHATLFFAVPKSYEDPLQMGSLGGGFNFECA